MCTFYIRIPSIVKTVCSSGYEVTTLFSPRTRRTRSNFQLFENTNFESTVITYILFKMTSATKRKHVVKEMLENYSVPSEDQRIVKVLGTPGSNLHEVITKEGARILCSLPVKFRKNIWIKRGDYVVIEPIKEGDKVKAEIVRILYPQHVKSLQSDGNWPAEFDSQHVEPANRQASAILEDSDPSGEKVNEKSLNNNESEDCYSSDEDNLEDIPTNTNRPPTYYEEDSSSDSEDNW